MLSALFRGLIDYDPETSEPEFTGVAESITSPDEGLTWEIVLNDGWTFHDGTPGHGAVVRRFVELLGIRAQRGSGVGFLRIDRRLCRSPVRNGHRARPGDR